MRSEQTALLGRTTSSARGVNAKAHSRSYPWPTTTGAAVFAAAFIAWLRAGSATVAIGFFVPLVAMMVLDFALSVAALLRRPVDLRAMRTHAAAPNGLTFSVDVEPGFAPLQILMARISMLSLDADEVNLQADRTSAEITLPNNFPRSATHVRYRVSTSTMGLIYARRWVAQATPPLHQAPGPHAKVSARAIAVDELANLRAYVPGDRMSHVSWSATARTGQVHVRSSGHGDDEVTVVVDLGSEMREMDGDRLIAAHVLEMTSSVITELIAQGATVRLHANQTLPKLYDDERMAALASPMRRGKANLKVKKNSAALLDGGAASQIVSVLVVDEHDLVNRLANVEHSPAISYPPAPYILIEPTGITTVS